LIILAGKCDAPLHRARRVRPHVRDERHVLRVPRAIQQRAGHGLDPQAVYDYVSSPYRPYLTDTFTFTREFMRDTVQRIIDVNGPHAAVIEQIDMPPSFVMLDRVVWGVSALWGKLAVTGRWREMLLEYRLDRPPTTDLGRAELQWRQGTGAQ
jgi:hypothetical protein